MITPDNIDYIQSAYPAPIAATFWQVAQHPGAGSDVFAKHTRLISLFEVILQYTCAIMLSYYRQRVDNIPEVEGMLETVRRPQLGHWQGLQRTLMKAYTQGEDNPLIADLCRSFTERSKDIERVSAYRRLREWSESEPDNRKGISYSDVSAQMVTYRNWLTHGPGKLLGQTERVSHVPKVETLLTDMLLDLACLVQYPLVYVREIVRHREHERVHLTVCMGTSQRWRPVEVMAQGDLTAEHCYICRKTEEGTYLPLLDIHPFVICTHCKKEPGRRQAFVLNEGGHEDKGSLSYISYECGHSFNIAEDDDPHLKDDMERLLNHDRWAEYLVQRALRRHGGYLQPIFRMFKEKESQPSYFEEYRQLEKTLREEKVFGFPQPIVQQIFAQYEIRPPVEEPLSIEAFTATPTSIERSATTVLEWRTTGATRIVIEPEIGEVEAEGRRVISPNDSTTYTLNAGNKANASRTASVSITVSIPPGPPDPPMPEPPVIQWFTARPERIELGTGAALTWGTQGVVRAVIDPEVGEVAAIGQCEVRPSETVVYTLLASNTVGKSLSQSVKLEVFVPAPPPPPGSLEEIWQTQLSEPVVKLIRSPQTDCSFAVGKEGAIFFLGKDGQQLWQAHAEAPLRAVTFTTDGQRLVVADWNGSVRCYDECSENPLWGTQVPGVVSALEAGRWRGQQGIFVGTWRQGLFFCDAEGQLHSVDKRDFTISALSAFSNREGCITGDWEGGVTLYTSDGSPRELLRQPVRALACLGEADRVLVLTTNHSFYALDEHGKVFWLYESPAPVASWAFANKASKCIYCTDGGQHYEIRVAGSGQHRLVEERALRELVGGRHDWLAVDAEADYLVARNREGELSLYAGETLCPSGEEIPSRVSGSYFDSYGFILMAAANNSVYAFRNQHKLAHSRPSKLKIEIIPNGAFALGKSTIVELRIANIGKRPAIEVRGSLKGRFAQPVTFEVERILPGEVTSRRRDVEPQVAGAFTVSAELHHLDGGEARTQRVDDLLTVEVGE